MVIITGAAVVLTSLVAIPLYRTFVDISCVETWKEAQFTDLKRAIQLKLYGQHIAQNMVQLYLRKHLMNSNPRKALVMSFHGTTGCGKNYLLQIVADKLIPEGLKNEYVQYWMATHHFSDQNKVLQYQDEIRNTVIQNLEECKRSFFIFDEAHNIPPGLLDVLSSCFVDRNAWIGDQDCTKATFIFISNTGSKEINQVVWDSNLQSKKRNDLTVSDFKPLITNGVFNETAGFHYSHLAKKNIIDHYVPFLPLEKIHVKQCIQYFWKARDCPFSLETLSELADEVNYVGAFAPFGCRGIESLIRSNMDHECVRRPPKARL